ncbi:MAG: hypothetical protein ACI8PB_001483 [Desulforhopalus sp.]|jgi:hypothetical protein
MAEKIHYQQPAQLKGCVYFPSPNFSLYFAQPNKVEPSDQSSFFPSKTHSVSTRENVPTPYTPRTGTEETIFPITTSKTSALVPLKSYLSLFTRAPGLLHTIGSLFFSYSTQRRSNKNAHWRTIVVTQQ